MSETVRAVYENGVLRPLSPLALREHEEVRIQLVHDNGGVRQVLRELVSAGVITAPSGHSDARTVTEEDLAETAEALGRVPGRPLSEVVIENRGER